MRFFNPSIYICSYFTIFKSAFMLFVITNIFLFVLLFQKDKRLSSPRQHYYDILMKYFIHLDNEWRLKSYNSKQFNHFKELNCSALKQIKHIKFIAAGWTKSTFQVILHNQTITLKTINIEGHDIYSCLNEFEHFTLYDCYLKVASKMLHEIVILRNLSHDNIIRVLGYCIPDHPDFESQYKIISIFEELGEPINVINLLQLSWEDRLKISFGLTQLLDHLASKSIALNDFRRQQFVLINGYPKLIDVDDIGFEEPTCLYESCCISKSLEKTNTCVTCINFKCQGYNEKMNIIQTGAHFIKHILPPGAPKKLLPLIENIIQDFHIARQNAKTLLNKMINLTNAFIDGFYRTNQKENILSGYKIFNNADISSKYDYRCQFAISSYSCTISVMDAEEAAQICWYNSTCNGFVFTELKTWTGRRIVHFKNGIGKLQYNNRTTFYKKLNIVKQNISEM